ncbi:MAG: hypothetical protein JWN70_4917 [Planctomycetaceae bacterium]|nr:hypothetical protein [Planctomycetaceae bacterium]
MKLQMIGLSVAMMFVVAATGALAQNDQSLSAGRKIRDGAVAHGVQMYQQHAQNRSQVLYYQAQTQTQTKTQTPVAKAEATDLVTGIKSDLAAADKELAKLKADHPKEPEVLKLIASIEKHHANVRTACTAAEEHAKKEHHDHVAISDCSADMWHELEAGSAETTKLMKVLKVDKIEAPKKPAAKKEAAK